jgi:hypothetical protein
MVISDRNGDKCRMNNNLLKLLPTQVQLQPFQAPTDSRYRRMAPITVFLEAFKKKKVGEICRLQPRVMAVTASVERLYFNKIVSFSIWRAGGPSGQEIGRVNDGVK